MTPRDATLSSGDHRKPEDPVIAARLDAGSANCATLILNVRNAMRAMRAGQVLEVIAYDPTSQLDLEAWCRMTGNRYLSVTTRETYQLHYLEKKEH